MQTGRRCAAGMYTGDGADGVSGGEALTGMDGCAHRLVGGTDTAGMIKGHHGFTGHDTGERDDTSCWGTDALATCGGEINAAMPRQPRLSWSVERAQRDERAKGRLGEKRRRLRGWASCAGSWLRLGRWRRRRRQE